LSRPVAIKVVRCADAGFEENFRRRFLQEASILAQLQHPNIVTLLEYGPLGDRSEEHYFMAMEYLRGETLAKRFKRSGRLSIEECIRLSRQIGRGLREAHRRGFIHRDLKPSNIMLVPEDDQNDIVKLVDFGIGKIVNARTEVPVHHDGEEMTRVGLLLGSPRYMSPEQIRSEPVELRTDLYGLGVILFQALTGRLPFDCRTEVELLIAHCSVPPPQLSDVCPSQFFPESLSVLVRALLEKQAKNRPTIEEFLEYLAGIEEEVFGTVALAGPTLQGLSALPPSMRPSSSTSAAIDGPAPARPRWSPSPGQDGEDLDATPVLAPAALSAPPQPVPRRKQLVAGVAGALSFLLVTVLFWVVARPSGFRRDADPRTRVPPPTGLPSKAVTKAPVPNGPTGGSVPPTSFTLSIDSIPSDATVTEGDRLIGVTPVVVTIARSSVSVGPRRFVVRHEGYAPFTLEQGDSKAAVRTFATLSAIAHTRRDRARRAASKHWGYAPLTPDQEHAKVAAKVATKIATPAPATTPAAGTAPDPEGFPAPRRGGGNTLDIRTRR
jgi:serine/threonine-protein kinase